MVISKPKHFLKLYQMGVQLSYCSRDPKNSGRRNTEVEFFFTQQPSRCPLRCVCQCCSMDELGVQVALILLFPQPLGTVSHVLRPRLGKYPHVFCSHPLLRSSHVAIPHCKEGQEVSFSLATRYSERREEQNLTDIQQSLPQDILYIFMLVHLSHLQN